MSGTFGVLLYLGGGIFDILMPIAILGSFGATLYFFTKVLTDYFLKKKMVEKGFVNDETQSIFKKHASENKFAALKWGILILSAGIALILIHTMNVDPETPLPYGIFSICIATGFLIYYVIVKREIK
jgi:hypothetical protein